MDKQPENSQWTGTRRARRGKGIAGSQKLLKKFFEVNRYTCRKWLYNHDQEMHIEVGS